MYIFRIHIRRHLIRHLILWKSLECAYDALKCRLDRQLTTFWHRAIALCFTICSLLLHERPSVEVLYGYLPIKVPPFFHFAFITPSFLLLEAFIMGLSTFISTVMVACLAIWLQLTSRQPELGSEFGWKELGVTDWPSPEHSRSNSNWLVRLLSLRTPDSWWVDFLCTN